MDNNQCLYIFADYENIFHSFIIIKDISNQFYNNVFLNHSFFAKQTKPKSKLESLTKFGGFMKWWIPYRICKLKYVKLI